MNIRLKTELPILTKWIIKYDDRFQMPQFVQGRIIGNSNQHKNGEAVVINNIEMVDLKNKILRTYDGFKYSLLGSGKRMILLDENDILEIALREVDDYYDD